jgi:hypothetical protein
MPTDRKLGPGDVAAERELARKLIKDELPYDPLLRGRVTFDVFSWDDSAAVATCCGWALVSPNHQ